MRVGCESYGRWRVRDLGLARVYAGDSMVRLFPARFRVSCCCFALWRFEVVCLSMVFPCGGFTHRNAVVASLLLFAGFRV